MVVAEVDPDARLRELDDRLTRGDEWIKGEREALTALYRAGQHEDEAWEKRAVRFFRQECKWYALWDEYLALRDKEAWARKSETEKAWDALRSDFPINAKTAGPQLVPHKRERAINV